MCNSRKKRESENARRDKRPNTQTSTMKVKQFKSPKNRIALFVGIGRFGLMGGFSLMEEYDWYRLRFGITILKFYITIECRWRVPNCGYEKGEIYYD